MLPKLKTTFNSLEETPYSAFLTFQHWDIQTINRDSGPDLGIWVYHFNYLKIMFNNE